MKCHVFPIKIMLNIDQLFSLRYRIHKFNHRLLIMRNLQDSEFDIMHNNKINKFGKFDFILTMGNVPEEPINRISLISACNIPKVEG